MKILNCSVVEEGFSELEIGKLYASSIISSIVPVGGSSSEIDHTVSSPFSNEVPLKRIFMDTAATSPSIAHCLRVTARRSSVTSAITEEQNDDPTIKPNKIVEKLASLFILFTFIDVKDFRVLEIFATATRGDCR